MHDYEQLLSDSAVNQPRTSMYFDTLRGTYDESPTTLKLK